MFRLCLRVVLSSCELVEVSVSLFGEGVVSGLFFDFEILWLGGKWMLLCVLIWIEMEVFDLVMVEFLD